MSEIERLEFPIRRIVYDVERDASVFYLDQPDTSDRDITPLRRGQTVVLKRAPGRIRVAEIAEVGEGSVTLYDWRLDEGLGMWDVKDCEGRPASATRLVRLAQS